MTLVSWLDDRHACEVFLSALEPRVNRVLGISRSRSTAPAFTHLLWFCDGLLFFFLFSWFFTSAITVDNDFYYAVFIWSALTFLGMYTRATNSDVVGYVRARWRSSLFVGTLASVYIVATVWKVNPTEHPDGLLLLFEVAWRGVAYGTVTSLALTAFPLAVAVGLFGGDIAGPGRRVGLALLTGVLVWTLSGAYYLGFRQFDRTDVQTPQLATTAVSLPAIVTLNPVGSILAQTAFHVAVTIRVFESNDLVPPEVEFIPAYQPPGVFGPR